MKGGLLKSFIIYGLGTGLSQSIQMFFIPMYTRYFTTEDYGAFETILSSFLLLAIFSMLQIESAVGRYYFELKKAGKLVEGISTGFWIITLMSVLVSIVFFFLSNLSAQFIFGTEKYTTALRLALCVLPVATIFNYFAVLIRFSNEPVKYTLITLTQIVSIVVLSMYLVIYRKMGIEAIFVGQLIGYSIGSALYIYSFRKYLKWEFSQVYKKKYLNFSLPILPAVLGAWGNGHANRFVLLSILSLQEIGLYMIAYKIASVFKLLEIAFRMAWQPFFIEHHTVDGHQREFKKIAYLVIGLMVVAVFLAFLLAKPIVMLIATPAYYRSSGMVGWLALAFALVIITSVVNIGPILTKRTIFNTYSYFIAILFNFSFIFYLVPNFGILGAAISLAIGNFVLLIVSWYFSERIYPVFSFKGK